MHVKLIRHLAPASHVFNDKIGYSFEFLQPSTIIILFLNGKKE